MLHSSKESHRNLTEREQKEHQYFAVVIGKLELPGTEGERNLLKDLAVQVRR